MDSQAPQLFQFFIRSPIMKALNRTLTLTLDDPTRNPTFNDLKLSFLPPSAPSSSFFFSLNGKPLADFATVVSAGVSPFSVLTLQHKLLGGGGDGGATGAESRDCYLNMYAEKKPDKVDPNEKRLSKWTTCALSFEPLKPPCVIDRLGNVFNKEALVKALLGKSLPKAFRHIKGLKDMIPIHLSMIPGLESNDSFREVRFQCPVSGFEFNGKYKFFALRKCGHVLSAKALKEVKSSACLVCHSEYVEEDKIVINGSDEEVAALREKMEAERAGKVKEKKPKKGRNEREVPLALALDGEAEEGANRENCSIRLSGKKHGIDANGVQKPISGKLELNEKVANDCSAKGGVNAKRFKAVDIAPANANKSVYASIFTSSSKSDFKETFSCRSLPLGRN